MPTKDPLKIIEKRKRKYARHRDRILERQREYRSRPDVVERYRAASIARTKASRERKRAWLRDLKTGKPCEDCGVVYPPRVMEFHHTNGDKEFAIGSKIDRYGKARILAEIEKCTLLCANCHRLRH